MGKAVKTKKELDENKRAWESTTLKIGLVSSIVTVLNLILDGISIFYVNRLVFAIIGIIVAVILVIVFSSKKLEKKIDKIKNKEYVRRIIEATSLSALFTFLIERTIIPFATENFQYKISAIYMIAIFIALPVITFIVLFKKKEWNYNVD